MKMEDSCKQDVDELVRRNEIAVQSDSPQIRLGAEKNDKKNTEIQEMDIANCECDSSTENNSNGHKTNCKVTDMSDKSEGNGTKKESKECQTRVDPKLLDACEYDFSDEAKMLEYHKYVVEDWQIMRVKLLQIIDRKDRESADLMRKLLGEYSFQERQCYVYGENLTATCRPLIFEACTRDNPYVLEYLVRECGSYIHDFVRFKDYLNNDDWSEDIWMVEMTPLYLSAVRGKILLVKELLRLGADPLRKNNLGVTPIHAAIRNGKTNTVKCLVEHIGGRLDVSYSPTMLASIGKIDLCVYLLSVGLDPDYADENGNTAFHMALKHKCGKYDKFPNDKNALLLLTYAGVKMVHRKNNDGHSAIVLAASMKFENLVKILAQYEDTDKIEVINGEELLAASLYNSQEIDHEEAIEMWTNAMKLRYKDSGNPILKPEVKPKKVFHNAVEPKTLEELGRLPEHHESLLRQSALIGERVLGEHRLESITRLRSLCSHYSRFESDDDQESFKILSYILDLLMVSGSRHKICTLAKQLVMHMFQSVDNEDFMTGEDLESFDDAISVEDVKHVLKLFIELFDDYNERIDVLKHKVHVVESREKTFEGEFNDIKNHQHCNVEQKCGFNDNFEEIGNKGNPPPTSLDGTATANVSTVEVENQNCNAKEVQAKFVLNHDQEMKNEVLADEKQNETSSSYVVNRNFSNPKFVVHEKNRFDESVAEKVCKFCVQDAENKHQIDTDSYNLEKTYNSDMWFSIISQYKKDLDTLKQEKTELLYLIVDAIFYLFKINYGEDLDEETKGFLKVFIAKDPRGRFNETLLHAAVVNRQESDTGRTEINYSVTNHMLNTYVTTMCALGVPINSFNKINDTPLHKVFREFPHDRRFYGSRKFPDIWETIAIFVSNGSHVDFCNVFHISPLAIMKTLKIEFEEVSSLSLQCLAANVIMANGIPYKGLLPATLEKFVEHHDCNMKEEKLNLRKLYRELYHYLQG